MRFAIVLALLVATRVVHADDELARARQLEASLEYDQALAIVDGILARGGADPSRYVELHLLAGKLAGGLDRAELARDHFARVLAIRPETALPDGTSPKLTDPFAAAKARTRPLEVHATISRGLVTLEALDPLDLVAGIALHVVVAGKHADLVERGSRRLVIPERATAIEIAALDASGNRLWVWTPPPAKPVVDRIPDEDPRSPVYARWTTWAAITGVALVAGTLSAWRLDSAQRDWDKLRAGGNTDFTALEAVEQRGRRWALATNLGFGVAAATGIATVIFGVRGHSSPSLAVTPGPGAGLGVAGRF